MKQATYHAPAPRAYEIAIGVVLALTSTGLIGVAALAGYRMVSWGEVPTSVAWVATVFLGVGGMLAPIAVRLLTGRGRHGGETLLSAGTIRLGGLLFALAPLVALFTSPWHAVHLIGSFSMSAACFALAAHRERVVGLSQQPTSHDS